jgi:hypothetical protein
MILRIKKKVLACLPQLYILTCRTNVPLKGGTPQYQNIKLKGTEARDVVQNVFTHAVKPRKVFESLRRIRVKFKPHLPYTHNTIGETKKYFNSWSK